MMNLRLTIGLLLVHVANSAPHVIVKRGATQANLPAINAGRREVGKIIGVSVPDLVWDEGLVAQINSMSANCDGWMNTVSSRFAPDDPDRNGAKLVTVLYAMLLAIGGAEQFPDQFSKVDKDMLKQVAANIETSLNTATFTLGHFELFNPLQTKIGCAQKKCEGSLPKEMLKILEPLQLEGDMFAFYSVCLLGPSGVWNIDTLRKVGPKSQSLPGMGSASASNWSMATTALISVLYMYYQ